MNHTVQDLVRRLRELQRYQHRVCGDGDGYIDDWASEDDCGDYVMWKDVQKLADEFETPNAKNEGQNEGA